MTIPHNWPRPRRPYNRSIARAELPAQLAAAALYLAARRRPAWPASLPGIDLAAAATTTIRTIAQLGPLDLYALVVLHIYSTPAAELACEVVATCGLYTGTTRAQLGKGDNLVEVLVQIGTGAPRAPGLEELAIAITLGPGTTGYRLDSLLVQPLPMGSPWSADEL